MYDAFENGGDTLALRRVALAVASDFLVTYTLGLSPHAFAVSQAGEAIAWTRQSVFEVEPESIRVATFVSGTTAGTGPRALSAVASGPGSGIPVLFAPDPNQFLFHPGTSPSALEQWSSITGTSVPFALGLPAGARGTALRWDAGGVKALYAMGARELWMRNATAGSDTRLLLTPGDSLVASTPAWSPDGTRAAVWTGPPPLSRRHGSTWRTCLPAPRRSSRWAPRPRGDRVCARLSRGYLTERRCGWRTRRRSPVAAPRLPPR